MLDWKDNDDDKFIPNEFDEHKDTKKEKTNESLKDFSFDTPSKNEKKPELQQKEDDLTTKNELTKEHVLDIKEFVGDGGLKREQEGLKNFQFEDNITKFKLDNHLESKDLNKDEEVVKQDRLEGFQFNNSIKVEQSDHKESPDLNKEELDKQNTLEGFQFDDITKVEQSDDKESLDLNKEELDKQNRLEGFQFDDGTKVEQSDDKESPDLNKEELDKQNRLEGFQFDDSTKVEQSDDKESPDLNKEEELDKQNRLEGFQFDDSTKVEQSDDKESPDLNKEKLDKHDRLEGFQVNDSTKVEHLDDKESSDLNKEELYKQNRLEGFKFDDGEKLELSDHKESPDMNKDEELDNQDRLEGFRFHETEIDDLKITAIEHEYEEKYEEIERQFQDRLKEINKQYDDTINGLDKENEPVDLLKVIQETGESGNLGTPGNKEDFLINDTKKKEDPKPNPEKQNFYAIWDDKKENTIKKVVDQVVDFSDQHGKVNKNDKEKLKEVGKDFLKEKVDKLEDEIVKDNIKDLSKGEDSELYNDLVNMKETWSEIKENPEEIFENIKQSVESLDEIVGEIIDNSAEVLDDQVVQIDKDFHEMKDYVQEYNEYLKEWSENPSEFKEIVHEKAREFSIKFCEETFNYTDEQLVDNVVGIVERDAEGIHKALFDNHSMKEAISDHSNEVLEDLKEQAINDGKQITDELLDQLKEEAAGKSLDAVLDVFAGEGIKLFRMVNDTVKKRSDKHSIHYEGDTFKEQILNGIQSYKNAYKEEGILGIGKTFGKGIAVEAKNICVDYYEKSTTTIRLGYRLYKFAKQRLG